MIHQSILLNLTHLNNRKYQGNIWIFHQLSKNREKSKRSGLPSSKEHGISLSTDITFYSKLFQAINHLLGWNWWKMKKKMFSWLFVLKAYWIEETVGHLTSRIWPEKKAICAYPYDKPLI